MGLVYSPVGLTQPWAVGFCDGASEWYTIVNHMPTAGS